MSAQQRLKRGHQELVVTNRRNRAIVEASGEGDQRTRRLVFVQRVDAPGPVRKLFGETTKMEERGKLDAQKEPKRWRFEMIPDRMPDKIRITGETWLEPGPGGGDRVVATEIDVKMFGIGALVEHYVARQSQRSQDRQTAFMRRFIVERGLAQPVASPDCKKA